MYNQYTQHKQNVIKQCLDQQVMGADTPARQLLVQKMQVDAKYYQDVFNTLCNRVESLYLQGKFNPEDYNSLVNLAYEVYNDYVAFFAINYGTHNITPAPDINTHQAMQQAAGMYVNYRDGDQRFLLSFYQQQMMGNQQMQPMQQVPQMPFGNNMQMQGFQQPQMNMYGQIQPMQPQMMQGYPQQQVPQQYGGGFAMTISNPGASNTANMDMNLMSNSTPQPSTSSNTLTENQAQDAFFNIGNRNSGRELKFNYYINTGYSDEEISKRKEEQTLEEMRLKMEAHNRRVREDELRRKEEHNRQANDSLEKMFVDTVSKTPEEHQKFISDMEDPEKVQNAIQEASIQVGQIQTDKPYYELIRHSPVSNAVTETNTGSVVDFDEQPSSSLLIEPVEAVIEDDPFAVYDYPEDAPPENVPVRVLKRRPSRVINTNWMAIPEKDLDVWVEGNEELDEHRCEFVPRDLYPVYDDEIEWVKEGNEYVGYLNYSAEGKYYREPVAFRNPSWNVWTMTKYTERGYYFILDRFNYPVQKTYKLDERQIMERKNHIIPTHLPVEGTYQTGIPYSETHGDTDLLKAADNLLLSDEELKEQLAKLSEEEKEFANVDYDGTTREVLNLDELVSACLVSHQEYRPNSKAAVYRVVTSNTTFCKERQNDTLALIKECETMDDFYETIYKPIKEVEPVLAKRLVDLLDRNYNRVMVKCGLPNVHVTCSINIYKDVENTQILPNPRREEQYKLSLKEMFENFISEEFLKDGVLLHDDEESRYLSVLPVTGSVLVVDKEMNEFEGVVGPDQESRQNRWFELSADDYVELNTFLINLISRNEPQAKEFYIITKDGFLIEAIKGYSTYKSENRIYIRILN